MNDGLLEVLVALAEDNESLEHDVTLQVGGCLVSGFIIGRKKYFESHPTLRLLYKELEKTRAALGETSAAREEEDDSPSFIHLRDARLFVPGSNPTPTNGGIFWRGNIASVHAFWFGTLTVQP